MTEPPACPRWHRRIRHPGPRRWEVAEAATAPDAARHVAFFYSDDRDYAAALGAFAAAGVAAGQPVFIAVPGPKIGPLRDALGGRAADVTFADMTEMGRNPAWIIPRVQSFIDASGGRHVRYVGEPIWAERTAAELREATKHEALINLAFGQAPASILCPYDSRRLSTAVLADAEHTHPAVRHGGQALDPSGTVTPSAGYRGPGELPAGLGGPLPPCPDDTESLTYRDELTTVRALVARQAGAAAPPRLRSRALRQRGRREHDPARRRDRHPARLARRRRDRVPDQRPRPDQGPAGGPAPATARHAGRPWAVDRASGL